LNNSRERAKVLSFISSLAGGGAERVLTEILSHITRENINPTLLLLYPFDDSPYREYLPGDVKVTVVARKSDSFFEKVKQLINLMKFVRKEKPRVIVSILTHTNIMALFSGMLFRISVIVCEHVNLGEILNTRAGKRILGLPARPLVKILYRYAGRVIAVSEGIRENLVGEFNISAEKIEIIRNPMDLKRITKLTGVPPDHPFFEERAPVIIAAGRLVPQKRFDILIEAFGMVLSEMDARLIVLGEGPQKGALKKLAGDRGIADKVSFAGFQKNPYCFLSKAEVFVLSSGYEGLPMVLLEAMACGILLSPPTAGQVQARY
jgi:glycosyltransferase involved in cell wall biosynthesis